MRALRIVIDARLAGNGRGGGVETLVVGLARGLSALEDGDEEYLFLTARGADEWLRPHLAGPCRILEGPPPPWPAVHHIEVTIEHHGFQGAGGAAWEKVRTLPDRVAVPLALSDGSIERARADLVHFSFQEAFLTERREFASRTICNICICPRTSPPRRSFTERSPTGPSATRRGWWRSDRGGRGRI
ncbi:MAG: hypothetical protein ACP5U2_11200 [Bryobacteraceae bacterium]